MFRFLVCDDHPLFRQGLLQLLHDNFVPIEVGEAACGEEMRALADNKEWDLALADMMMPDVSGVDVVKKLKVRQPRLPILVMSMHEEALYAVRMLKAGAHGYLCKTAPAHEVVDAIKTVMSGRRYVSESAAEQLVHTLLNDSEKPLHENLTDREMEILCLLASGKRLKEIGDVLCISANTVSTYRMRILEKLNLKSNAELVNYSIQYSLVKL